MKTKIAINGFGRIGRIAARIAQQYDDIEIVAVNSRSDDAAMRKYLLEYDSTYGKASFKVEVLDEEHLKINRNIAYCFKESDIQKIDWKAHEVDWVIESTGKFTDGNLAKQHLVSGAKKVLISAPAENVDGTFILGVNHEAYDPQKHNVIAMASCTTNCLAPICKILDENWKIKRGTMTTTHAMTSSEMLLDGSAKSFRLSRGATQSMIPSTTGASKALKVVLPQLDGKLTGVSVRVPLPTVSLVDLTCEVEKSTTPEEIKNVFLKNIENGLQGIMQWCDEELVSVDFRGDPHSCSIDGKLVSVMQGNLIKIFAWYDNEWMYAHRLIDFIRFASRVE